MNGGIRYSAEDRRPVEHRLHRNTQADQGRIGTAARTARRRAARTRGRFRVCIPQRGVRHNARRADAIPVRSFGNRLLRAGYAAPERSHWFCVGHHSYSAIYIMPTLDYRAATLADR